MLYVGIDVASQKHDCCILSSDGKVLVSNLTIDNTREGFELLIETIRFHQGSFSPENIRVGLESTGHYSNNILSFLVDKKLSVKVFNPLQVNLYRKGQTLRKTKTDKADAKFLAVMLFSDNSASYAPVSSRISELKALTRHRARLIALRSRLKVSVSRLVTILFPELTNAVNSIHQTSSYALLLEYPTARDIANCHLTKLSNLINKSSRGVYNKEKAQLIKELASKSIGQFSVSIGIELQQTIRIINNLQNEINILDGYIKNIMKELNSPILTIPGISYILGAIILAEIGEIKNFDSPSKLLAYAGLDPSTYQSGKFTAGNTPMVKRGSTYLRYALLNAARLVAVYDQTFKAYADKKKSEGKHYFVAMSHVGKKLVRVIHHLLTTNSEFVPSSVI